MEIEAFRGLLPPISGEKTVIVRGESLRAQN
jgi:hypothetical protein